MHRTARELQRAETELDEVLRHWTIVLEKSKHLSTYKPLKLMAIELYLPTEHTELHS